MNIPKVQTIIFGVLFFIFFILVFRLFSPFFSVILWSVLIYILFSPLYHAILKRIKVKSKLFQVKKGILAGAFAVISIIVILLPFMFLGLKVGTQISNMINNISSSLASIDIPIPKFIEDINFFIKKISFNSIDLLSYDFKTDIMLIINKFSQTIVATTTVLIKNILYLVVSFFFIIFTLYFFYMDGDYLLELFVKAVPIDTDYMYQFIHKFKTTANNLIQGYFIVSIIQSVIAFLIFLVLNVKNALLMSVLTFFATFIPMIGTAIVWIPLGLSRIFSGNLIDGIILMLVSALLISTLDNFIRPSILRDKIKIHPLLIFFSILGGLKFYGFNGLILGPMLVMIFFTALDIFLELYKINKPENNVKEQ